MSGSPPFVNREENELDLRRIWEEALPIVGLIVLFAAAAALPYVLVMVVFQDRFAGLVFTLFAQLVVAVGTAIVLMYVIARAIQIADGSV